MDVELADLVRIVAAGAHAIVQALRVGRTGRCRGRRADPRLETGPPTQIHDAPYGAAEVREVPDACVHSSFGMAAGAGDAGAEVGCAGHEAHGLDHVGIVEVEPRHRYGRPGTAARGRFSRSGMEEDLSVQDLRRKRIRARLDGRNHSQHAGHTALTVQATLARLVPGRRTEEAIDLHNGQISREEVGDVELRAVRIQRNAMRMRSHPIGYCAHLGRRHEVIVARIGDGRVHKERILLKRDDLDLRRQEEGVLGTCIEGVCPLAASGIEDM